ncbi:hypothetical protein FO519_007440 [Halicephalobus sp. NKZ332]|nr:hypothetical protein FO519_007440 [Halicephalobus sp. NKZ332]
MNNTDPEDCNTEVSIQWLYVRTIWNIIAIFVDILMMTLLAKQPGLLFGCFDKLYMCTFVADLMANIERVPLASTINGAEWYLSYVMICSALFFNIDHAVLVVFPRDYPWMCNSAVKWTLVSFCWIIPVVWVLPMFGDCCGSVFLTEGSPPVFANSDVEDVYDCIDMTFETFVYLPVIFFCNCISIFVLHYRYLESEKQQKIEIQRKIRIMKAKGIWITDSSSRINLLPKLTELREFYDVGDMDSRFMRIHNGQTKKNTVLFHKRITAEFDMSIVTLIDQLIDAVGVFLYLLFWGGNNDWINVNVEEVLLMYDISWELGTTTQPYILMIICPQKLLKQETPA